MRTGVWSLNALLAAWSVAAIGSAMAHIVAPLWTAAGTIWPASPHWQLEIAGFDTFGAVVFGWVAVQREVGLKIRVVGALCCLSLFLGLNHLSGWLEAPRIFHVVFSIANLIAVTWGVLAVLLIRRVPSP